MSEYPGRRRGDTQIGKLPPDFQPGDYWRYVREDGTPVSARSMGNNGDNLTDGVWGVCSPKGGGVGTLVHHTVREHEDGTCSIRPGDGSSNSVWVDRPDGFHGFLEHGVWRDT